MPEHLKVAYEYMQWLGQHSWDGLTVEQLVEYVDLRCFFDDTEVE